MNFNWGKRIKLPIDYHTHILPGVDDGCKTLEESLNVIGKLQSNGTRKIYLSPHLYDARFNIEYKDVLPVYETFKADVAEVFPDIELVLSGEHRVSEKFLRAINNGHQLGVFDDNCILIEDSLSSQSQYLSDTIFELQLLGLTVILAHPERYLYYHEDFSIYNSLKERGVKFQMNTRSLSGGYGRTIHKVAKKLKRKGMVDFYGSDTHRL